MLETMKKPVGIINLYSHKDSLEFVSLSKEDPKMGYFIIPKEKILKEYHAKNLIVANGSILMAKRMVPGTSWGKGISYLDVGTGYGTGTLQSPQVEEISQTELRVVLARKAITSWCFIDMNGDPTVSDTDTIELTTTFADAEAVGAIVEMGLFGGADATITAGTGLMFNYKVFAVWNKPNDSQLTIVWRIKF